MVHRHPVGQSECLTDQLSLVVEILALTVDPQDCDGHPDAPQKRESNKHLDRDALPDGGRRQAISKQQQSDDHRRNAKQRQMGKGELGHSAALPARVVKIVNLLRHPCANAGRALQVFQRSGADLARRAEMIRINKSLVV